MGIIRYLDLLSLSTSSKVSVKREFSVMPASFKVSVKREFSIMPTSFKTSVTWTISAASTSSVAFVEVENIIKSQSFKVYAK